MSFIRGRIERVIHSNGSFHVLLCEVFEHTGLAVGRHTTVAGHLFGLPHVVSGMALQLDGEWVKHKKFGGQLKIDGWQPWAEKADDVVYFLSAVFDGRVPEFALQQVANRFGSDTYRQLENDNDESLTPLSGEWRLLMANRRFLERMLRAWKVSPTLVSHVIARFGSQLAAIVEPNPYRLIEADGFSFKQVDGIGRRAGIGADDPRRLGAAIVWVLREQAKDGHLFLREAELDSFVRMVLEDSGEVREGAVKGQLPELARLGAVVVDTAVGVYLPELYAYEREAAAMFSSLMAESPLALNLTGFLDSYQRDGGIELSGQQREAIERIAQTRVLVVTGAPGTGKTTLVRAFVHLFRACGLSQTLMAPTGIAAKRLGHVTGMLASTVHRALGCDGWQWARNRNNKLNTKAVILDEASMMDQELFFRLLDALEPGTILVLVGDDAQLPSVGPGNVLRELIGCTQVPTVRLVDIYRQAGESDIVKAAHCVRNGKSPLTLPKKESPEFQFVPVLNEELIVGIVIAMARKLKDRDANFQVLAPKYEGTVGVNNLNVVLRDTLNPDIGQPTFELFDFNVRRGDRLMVIKNQYKLGIYNGDIGKLVDITKDFLSLRIHGIGKGDDILVKIPVDDAPRILKLAYAVTVHRCQGEEFETVIMPLVRSQRRMLQRNLFYTALTRARKKVWILGEADAIDSAVRNDKVVRRNTVLGKVVGLPAEVRVEAAREQPEICG